MTEASRNTGCTTSWPQDNHLATWGRPQRTHDVLISHKGANMSARGARARIPVAATLVVVALCIVCAQAFATAPGEDGRMLISDPTEGAIWSVNPDGSDARLLWHGVVSRD